MSVFEEMECKAIIWAHYQYDIKSIIKEIEKVMVQDQWLTIMA